MSFLSDQFFWLVLTALMAVVVAIPVFASVLQWVSAKRKDPLVVVHYWWEEVIDYEKLWMSPFVTVGTLRPTDPRRVRSYEDKVSIAASKPLPRSQATMWILYPAHRLGRYQRVGVRVLRVMIFNQSKRQPVGQNMFGVLRFEIATQARHVHGWARGVLGTSASVEEGHDYGTSPARVHVHLPGPLDLEGKVRDDLTITNPLSQAGTPAVDVRTSSDMRLRLKPWPPSTSRPWHLALHRLIRWMLLSRRAKLFAET